MSLVRRAIFACGCALLVACHGRDDPDVVADCDNGAIDGDETDVDCGGSCDIDCGIDQACATGDDCMFGACDADVCVAPADRPAATGPVTASLLPEGGSIGVVSDEGVTMTLTVPAGAVDSPLELEIVPRTPGAGEWLSLAVSPHVVLHEPMTLSFTLPAGLVVTSDANAVFGAGTPLPTTRSGSTATAQARFLGSSDAATARDGHEEAELHLRRLALERLVEELRASMDSLEATFDARVAVEARLELLALLQREGDERFDDLVPPLMAEVKATTCAQIATEMAGVEIDVEQGASSCPWQAFRAIEPLLAWVAIGQQLGGFGEACAVLDDNSWRAPIEAELRATEANVRSVDADDVAAFRACECHADNPTPPRPEACSGAEEEDPFYAYVDGVLGNAGLAARVGVIEAEDSARSMAGVWQTEIVEPYVAGVRDRTWDYCHDQGEQWALGELADRVDDPAPVLRDLQYCGSELGLTVEDAEGALVDAATAGGTDVDVVTTEAAVEAPGGGSLVLAGPLRSLRCHPAGTENDSIVVKRVADTVTEVARRTGNAAGFLLDADYPLELDVDTLRDGLEADAPVVLEVWRETDACGGAYGETEVKLFDVEGRAPPPWSVTVMQHAPTAVYSHIVANPDCPSTSIASDTPVPVTLENTCGSMTAHMAAPDRLEVVWDGSGASDYVAASFTMRFDVGAPGTVTATIAKWTGWTDGTDALELSVSGGGGIFATAPRAAPDFKPDAILLFWYDYFVVPTNTWHVDAGIGELVVHAGVPPTLDTTLLVFEYTPDP